MMRIQWFCPAALTFILLALPSGVSARLRQPALPGGDKVSLVLEAGTVIPTTTLPDGGSYESGLSVGASATWWAFRHLGLRAHFHRGSAPGVQPTDSYSAAAFYAGTVWLYGGDVVLRLPVMDGRVSPFISGGAGGKSYRWSHHRPRRGETTFAWTASGGIDIRPAGFGPFGVNIEGRYYRSKYYWHGLGYQDPRPSWEWHGPIVNDFIVAGGISVNW